MSTQVAPEEFGIQPTTATVLLADLPQVVEERKAYQVQYDELVKADIENPETGKKAKELRLRIRDNRTKGIEVWHKTNKELYLRAGQFLDAVKKKEIEVNKRMEDALEAIEKYQEIKEQKRIDDLRKERLELLAEYSQFVPSSIDLGTISADEYQKVFNGAKLQYEAHQEAERKAEEERIRIAKIQDLHNQRKEVALPYYQFWSDFEKTLNFGEQSEKDFNNFLERISKAKADFEEEQAAIRKENAKLAKEKADADARAKKAEDELIAKRKAEEEAEYQKIKAEALAKAEAERLAKAPIKDQLSVWVNGFQIPASPVSNEVSEDIIRKFDGFKSWALKQIENL